MGRRPHSYATKEQKERIIKIFRTNQDNSVRAIAKKVGVSEGIVSKTINKFLSGKKNVYISKVLD